LRRLRLAWPLLRIERRIGARRHWAAPWRLLLRRLRLSRARRRGERLISLRRHGLASRGLLLRRLRRPRPRRGEWLIALRRHGFATRRLLLCRLRLPRPRLGIERATGGWWRRPDGRHVLLRAFRMMLLRERSPRLAGGRGRTLLLCMLRRWRAGERRPVLLALSAWLLGACGRLRLLRALWRHRLLRPGSLRRARRRLLLRGLFVPMPLLLGERLCDLVLSIHGWALLRHRRTIPLGDHERCRTREKHSPL
jgi:hypothetical protein